MICYRISVDICGILVISNKPMQQKKNFILVLFLNLVFCFGMYTVARLNKAKYTTQDFAQAIMKKSLKQ